MSADPDALAGDPTPKIRGGDWIFDVGAVPALEPLGGEAAWVLGLLQLVLDPDLPILHLEALIGPRLCIDLVVAEEHAAPAHERCSRQKVDRRCPRRAGDWIRIHYNYLGKVALYH